MSHLHVKNIGLKGIDVLCDLQRLRIYLCKKIQGLGNY